MCETLGALCSQFCNKKFSTSQTNTTNAMDVDPMANPFQKLLPNLLFKLECIVDAEFDEDHIRFVEILSAVCLQSMLGCFMPQRVLDVFDKVFRVTSYWTQYRIARSASRYGQHYFAAKIYTKLASCVSIEKIHFFLTALSQISKAECVLNHGYDFESIYQNYGVIEPKSNGSVSVDALTIAERLEKAITLYWKAMATLKASSSPTHPFTFQSEFVRLRGQFLEAMFNVVIIKNTQSITPPPAIAHTLAQNSRDHLQKFGHVTNQLRKTVKVSFSFFS